MNSPNKITSNGTCPAEHYKTNETECELWCRAPNQTSISHTLPILLLFIQSGYYNI